MGVVNMLQMEDNKYFGDDDEEPVSVGRITTQYNDVPKITQLQTPLKPEQSDLIKDIGNNQTFPLISATRGAVQDEIIYDNQSIDVKLPADFQSEEYVAISSRKEAAHPLVIDHDARIAKHPATTDSDMPTTQLQIPLKPRPFCPSCCYLGLQLGETVDFRHGLLTCPRKADVIEMLQMEDRKYFGNDDEEPVSVEITHLQTPLKPEQSDTIKENNQAFALIPAINSPQIRQSSCKQNGITKA